MRDNRGVDESGSVHEGNEAVEAALGHRFRDPSLLETALSHPSYAYERDGTRGNERLEFLGDAVLDLVIAEQLYRFHPEWAEGELTRARAELVNTQALAQRARDRGFAPHLRLGKTERRTGGDEKDSILGNLFEALIGAIFLDGGFESAARFVEREFAGSLTEVTAAPQRDVKTRFQEWAHATHRVTPSYRALSDSGIDDDPERFHVEVLLEDRVIAEGRGRTKRLAERAAAATALAQSETADV